MSRIVFRVLMGFPRWKLRIFLAFAANSTLAMIDRFTFPGHSGLLGMDSYVWLRTDIFNISRSIYISPGYSVLVRAFSRAPYSAGI